MAHQEKSIGASVFKAQCLQLLDRVAHKRVSLVITKHGTPVARVVPIEQARRPLRGRLRDNLQIHGDIVNIDWSDDWEASR